MKFKYIVIIIVFLIALGIAGFKFLSTGEKGLRNETEGIMLLIEFDNALGLNNFVSEMNKRDIPGVLLVSTSFLEENQDDILNLQNYGIEIGCVLSDEPLWDISYEEQYRRISEAKEKVESLTGNALRIIGSKYFAYDENTLRVAENLGLEYVLGRGVTKAQATIFKPEEYNVKIFSVSNIDSPEWGTGSLCDYSYWARGGTPLDFEQQLLDAAEEYDKISPVSHTYIGGLKEAWNRVYLDFFDNTDIIWEGLNDFGKVDIELPFNEIPENREVQYETPKPLTPLEEEVNVENPCAPSGEVINFPQDEEGEVSVDDMIVFWNENGAMCIDLKQFLNEKNYPFIAYSPGDEGFSSTLSSYTQSFSRSEGISASFGYYPIIFFKGHAFSGFNDEIKEKLEDLIAE